MLTDKQKKHIEKLAKINNGKRRSLSCRRKMSLARKKLLGPLSSNWKGGKILVGGYWYIYSPNHPHKTKDKYVCEHRLVMEKKLGRYLKPTEIVHHINGNRQDNRVKNLVICLSSGQHTVKYHLKRSPKTGRFIS